METENNPLENPGYISDPLIGRVLEGYKFVGLLGRGGYGAVYLAQHPRIEGRQVAVKYVQIGNPEEADEAEHEINILASLQHANVVQIYDAFRYQNYQLIMMELVRGGSLNNHVEMLGKLDLATALGAMTQVADALAYVHSKGVLHLDLKPANVLLEPQDDKPTPRFVLTDFGIARFVQPGKNISGVVGTPAYMAPEQFGFGEGTPDRRSDIYQFGVILYELVVGTLPFEGGSLVDFARQHAYDPPPRPSSLAPGIPAALDDIILTALAKSQAERFQSAGEISRALGNLNMTTGPAAASTFPKRLAYQVRQQADQMEAVSIKYRTIADAKTIQEDATEPTAPRISLTIISADGKRQAVTFNKTPIIAGRGKTADMMLDYRTVSREHFQIDCDSRGQLRVTDRGSTHGTFLNGSRLPANQAISWSPEQHLQVEGFNIEITATPQPAQARAGAALQTTEVKRLLDRLQAQDKRPRLSMTASPEIVYVEMGKPQYIQVRVRPEDAPAARYQLRAVPGPGMDARWYTLSAEKMIEAGQSGTFEVAIAAPGIDVMGGQKHELILEVVSDNPEIPRAFTVIRVSVVPFMRFNLALNPGEVSHRRRRRAKLIITNNGNYTERFYIRMQAPDRLSIRPKIPQADIAASKYATIPLQFKPTRDAYKEHRLLYSVIVNTQSGMTERVNGSYVLPRPFRISWLLIVIVALIAAVLINWLVFKQEPAAQVQYFLDQINAFRQTVTTFLTGLGS